MDELSNAQRDIEQNVNPKIVFFDFALKMIVLLNTIIYFKNRQRMEEKFKLNGPCRGLCAKGCGRQNKQLNTYDYLADIPVTRRLPTSWKYSSRTRARGITTTATVCHWRKATSWP